MSNGFERSIRVKLLDEKAMMLKLVETTFNRLLDLITEYETRQAKEAGATKLPAVDDTKSSEP